MRNRAKEQKKEKKKKEKNGRKKLKREIPSTAEPAYNILQRIKDFFLLEKKSITRGVEL